MRQTLHSDLSVSDIQSGFFLPHMDPLMVHEPVLHHVLVVRDIYRDQQCSQTLIPLVSGSRGRH
jgi:hypothetical protein